MFDVQNLETGEVVLEMIDVNELRDFAEKWFPWDCFAGVSFEDTKAALESAGFKVYQL